MTPNSWDGAHDGRLSVAVGVRGAPGRKGGRGGGRGEGNPAVDAPGAVGIERLEGLVQVHILGSRVRTVAVKKGVVVHQGRVCLVAARRLRQDVAPGRARAHAADPPPRKRVFPEASRAPAVPEPPPR